MLIDSIREILGDELSEKVEEALKGRGKDGRDIELGIANDGTLCPVSKLKALKERYEAETTKIRLDRAIENEIIASKGKNVTAVVALIKNRDKLKLREDGTVKGLDLESIKRSDPYLFDTAALSVLPSPTQTLKCGGRPCRGNGKRVELF